MQKRYYTVYKVVCRATGMCYIGATVKPVKSRWREHIRRSENFDRDTPLYDDMRVLGAAMFKVVVLHKTGDFDTAMVLERAEIASHNTIWPNGYNLQNGGKAGMQWHQISKSKLSSQRVGRQNPFYGKTHTDEVITKIKKTRKVSEKWKQAMDALHQSNVGKSWGQHTDEAKARMSAAKKGVPQSREHVEKRMAGMRAARIAREVLKKAALVGE